MISLLKKVIYDNSELLYDEKEKTIERIDYGIQNSLPNQLPNDCLLYKSMDHIFRFYNSSLSTFCFNKLLEKNCEDEKNKLTIKILKTKEKNINIGIIKSDFNLSEDALVYSTSCWLFNCNGTIMFNKGNRTDILKDYHCKKGDIIGLKYNSSKGDVELFINNKSECIIFKDLDISIDYKFVISLFDIEDKIQIVE